MQFKRLFLTIVILLRFLSPGFAQEPTLLEHGGGIWTVAFSPTDTSLLATAGESNIIKLWNLRNNTAKTLIGHTGRIRSVAFSPDGALLASASDDGTIRLWNVQTRQNTATLQHFSVAVSFSPDGVLLATGGDRHVKLWNVNLRSDIATLEHDKWVWTVAFSHDGQFLAVGDGSEEGPGTVKIWDVQQQRVITTLTGDPKVVKAVTFSRDNRYLASSGWDGQLKVWDVSNWELIGTIPHTGYYGIEFSPDGKTLVSTNDGYVSLWSVEDGTRVARLPGPTDWLHPVDSSPNGTSFAVGAEDGLVRIYNIETDLDIQQPRDILRIIYFLPRDRTAQPHITTKLTTLIKTVQQFYADEMERHGFGRKTFTFETDSDGNAVVHRVNGKFTDAHYQNQTRDTVAEEIEQQFDTSRNIYFVATDISTELIDNQYCGRGGSRGDSGGDVFIPASGHCFEVFLAAHEIGHALGLYHDFRNDAYVMSYGAYRNELSPCAAEWLDLHRYFNIHARTFDQPTSVQMLSPSKSGPYAIRLRFEVTDDDGIGQAQLVVPRVLGDFGIDPQLDNCKSLAGKNNTVEFVTTELVLEPVEEVELQVMDARGNFTRHTFPIDISHLLPSRRTVSIPDASLAAKVRQTLDLTQKQHIIELDMLKLVRLEAAKRQIADLTGLQHAKNLKYLKLEDNQIQDIAPLAELTKLKHLSLWRNQIVNIAPLQKLTHLTDLMLTDNSIRGITPLAGLIQLRVLTLNGNQIHNTSPLAGLINLSSLRLAGNPIQDMSPLQALLQQNPELELDIANSVNPLSKITGPWLWMIAPTKVGQGGANSINIDSLDVASQGAITEVDVAANGAKVGDIVGQYAWTLGEITATGANNINDLINRIGLVDGGNPKSTADDTDVDDHSSYALITLESKTKQSDIVMRVGSDDAIKVWLNGEVVHTNAVDRGASDFQDGFKVDLKQGDNVLLVKVSELRGWWSMFVGIDTDVNVADIPYPVVLLAETQRLPLYWINDTTGTLHQLIGNTIENSVPSVNKATSLAVDMANEKLYWTEKTGNTTGRIRRVNLDGTNVQLIRDLTSVPLDITLDTAAGKLYLTNAWGKVQRLNLDGSNFQPNLITDLDTPPSLVLDVTSDKLYWIEQTSDQTGKVQRANLDGSNVELVKSLTSMPHDIAIDTVNSKLYLTNSRGKVQRLNTNGSNFQPNLITDLDVPEGIAVDTQSGKLYWTESGSIRRANLNGENIQDVVTGLDAPVGITLGTAPIAQAGPATPITAIVLPDKTTLLANYPNPFNPETWIPYQLASPSDVRLRIYDARGRLVRTLALGYQPAGYYAGRSRAAYWDGRNALGERVASGVYFYQLETDTLSPTRKMVILK